MEILHKKFDSGEDVYYVTDKSAFYKLVYDDGDLKREASDRDTFEERREDSDFENVTEDDLPGAVHSSVSDLIELF